MNTFIYRPVLTVVDVLEAGACLKGTLEYIEENGLQIVGDTEKLLRFSSISDYIKPASNKNGYGTGTCYGGGNGGGNGEGRGYGYFDGSIGYFSVYGDGYIDGSGSGYGDDYGDGYGDGDGNGDGEGYGDGNGDGDGYGDGNGNNYFGDERPLSE